MAHRSAARHHGYRDQDLWPAWRTGSPGPVSRGTGGNSGGSRQSPPPTWRDDRRRPPLQKEKMNRTKGQWRAGAQNPGAAEAARQKSAGRRNVTAALDSRFVCPGADEVTDVSAIPGIDDPRLEGPSRSLAAPGTSCHDGLVERPTRGAPGNTTRRKYAGLFF